jgi:hypothetical protein
MCEAQLTNGRVGFRLFLAIMRRRLTSRRDVQHLHEKVIRRWAAWLAVRFRLAMPLLTWRLQAFVGRGVQA